MKNKYIVFLLNSMVCNLFPLIFGQISGYLPSRTGCVRGSKILREKIRCLKLSPKSLRGLFIYFFIFCIFFKTSSQLLVRKP